MVEALRRLAIRALVRMATNGLVAAVASWHARVWSAKLFEEIHQEPIRLRDVLPWVAPRADADLSDFVSCSLPPIDDGGMGYSGERKIFGLVRGARTPST